MGKTEFTKTLTANDTGESGSHQDGLHIPKSDAELLAFLPELNIEIKNPDTLLMCVDDSGNNWTFRFVYYNNMHHDENGTRDEYRITRVMRYLGTEGAREGDRFSISHDENSKYYQIRILKKNTVSIGAGKSKIKLTGWSRAH